MATKFWNDKFLNTLSALVKDANAWYAFIALLENEHSIIIDKLNTPVDPEELIRINGVCRFIEHLKKTRDTALNLEKYSREDK